MSASPWATRNPTFHQIKLAEDELRQRILEGGLFSPYESLIQLNIDDLLILRQKFREAREANINSRDPQLLSMVSRRQASLMGAQRKLEANVSEEVACFEPHPRCEAEVLRDNAKKFQIFDRMDENILEHVVIAGGAALYQIMGDGDYDDYDLFIVGTDKPNEILQAIITHFCHRITYCIRTEHSVTLKLNNHMTVQIVLRCYRTPAEVVIGFDLDASGCCYHKGKLFCTPRALYSIETARLYVDPKRASKTYGLRLMKYAIGKRFSIDIPCDITIHHLNEARYLYSRYFIAPKNSYVRHLSSEEQEVNRVLEIRSREILNDSLIGLLVAQYLGRHAIRTPPYSTQSDYCPVEMSDDDTVIGIKFFRINDIEGIKTVGYGFRTKYLSPHYVHDLGDLTGHLGKSKISLGDLSPVAEFMTKNPGTQFSASFHPVELSWERWARTGIELDLTRPESVQEPIAATSTHDEPIIRLPSGVIITKADMDRLRPLLDLHTLPERLPIVWLATGALLTYTDLEALRYLMR